LSPATRRDYFALPARFDAIVAIMQVPFLDLCAQHEPSMPVLVGAFREVIPL
jgi:hypothetical protein